MSQKDELITLYAWKGTGYGGLASHAVYMKLGFEEVGIPIKVIYPRFFQPDEETLKHMEEASDYVFIIHYNDLGPSTKWICDHAKKYGQKVIVWATDQWLDPRKDVKDSVYKNAFKVTSSIDWWLEDWRKESSSLMVPEDKFTTIRHECRIGNPIPKDKAREILDIKTPYSVIELGFVKDEKYFDEMLNIIAPMKDITFLIAGGMDPFFPKILFEDKIKKLIQSNKMGDRVIWVNREVQEEELDVLYSAADLALAPSRMKHDTLGTINWSCGSGGGKTVIATNDQRGFLELEKYGACITCPLGDFSSKIREYLENEKLRKEQERTALEYSLNWTREKNARRYHELFQN